MLQLHIHALTLRMTPGAIAELRFVLELGEKNLKQAEAISNSFFGTPRTRGDA
jgi:hypothetical protein